MINRASSIAAASLAALLLSGSLSAQTPTRKLQLSFDNQGRVTLVAEGVSVGEILREWTRLGGSVFLGSEKLAGGLLPPVQFENRPEVEVLQSLLRSAAGYMIAARPVGSAGPSRVNAAIVATSTATASTSYSSSSQYQSPAVPVVTPGVDDANQGAAQPQPDPSQANRPAPQGYTPGPAPIAVPVIQPIGMPTTQPAGKTDPQVKPGGRGGGRS